MPRTQKRLAHIYRDRDGRWRWRLIASGRTVADCGYGYSRRFDALSAFRNLAVAGPVEVRQFNADESLHSIETETYQ